MIYYAVTILLIITIMGTFPMQMFIIIDIGFHFFSFHFISFHFISFHFISFHFFSFLFFSFLFFSFLFFSFLFFSFLFFSFLFFSFLFFSSGIPSLSLIGENWLFTATGCQKYQHTVRVRKWIKNGFRTALVFLSCLVAVSIPDFGLLIALVGSLGSSSLQV